MFPRMKMPGISGAFWILLILENWASVVLVDLVSECRADLNVIYLDISYLKHDSNFWQIIFFSNFRVSSIILFGKYKNCSIRQFVC